MLQHLIAAALAAFVIVSDAYAQEDVVRFEHVQVPMKQSFFTIHLSTYLYLPPGKGPFPLVVINHGKSAGGSMQPDSKFIWQAEKFIARGYAVIVPNRAGLGKSGGVYITSCADAESVRRWADSVQAAIDYARTLPMIDAQKIIVIGQSQGGLTAVGLGERNLPGVLGVVNFAGGLRSDRCVGWEGVLINDYRTFGAASKAPALFLYGDNDSFWGDGTLSKQFFDAYHAGNPASTYVDEGVFADGDSHMYFHRKSGYKTWAPSLWQFFDSLGLNSQVIASDRQAVRQAAEAGVFAKPVDR